MMLFVFVDENSSVHSCALQKFQKIQRTSKLRVITKLTEEE